MKTTKTEIRQGGAKAMERKQATKSKSAVPTEVAPEKPKSAPARKLGNLENSPATLLARAEADMGKLLESLNTQMSAAMHVFTELAALQKGKHEAVIRTKPLDRATAMFQRLVTELVDDRISEVLPTLVGLRSEMNQRAESARNESGNGAAAEFFTRGTEMLDQVLTNLEVHAFQPRVGDAFDPLIHLAIGEVNRPDLAGDVVAEVFSQGFRSVRGKVIAAARVKVNRR